MLKNNEVEDILASSFREVKGVVSLLEIENLDLVRSGYLDSLMWINLLMALEEKFSVDVNFDDLPGINKLEDLRKFLNKNIL